MDANWIQRFLGLLQCDAQPPSSTTPLRTNRPLIPDDPEGDDDLRSEFSCPFCYVEFDIGSLCSHIDEQHCFESQSAVCPVCAAKVGEDVVGHITLQHGHFFKRRRRFAKTTASSSSALFSIASEEPCQTSSSSMDQQNISVGCPLTAEQYEEKLKEAALRATFAQQLVLSTIFSDH